MSIVDESRSLYTTVSRLKISNFGENDVGAYSCVVSNMMGRANSTVRLFGESSIVCSAPTVAFSAFAHTFIVGLRALMRPPMRKRVVRKMKNF